MNLDILLEENLTDPTVRAVVRSRCNLRSYQAGALRRIYSAVQRQEGGKFTVTFPRQSGKNETQAQLESAVMSANLWRGGSIVKLLPTEKNQGAVSRKRLERILRGIHGKSGEKIRSSKLKTAYGDTEVVYLSASPNAAIVGATADLMLEVDEAQMVSAGKYDLEAAPMAASTNAVQVFWGTAWDNRTLLSRESLQALKEGDADGSTHRFLTDASKVGQEVPEYAEFVKGQIETLGREHPVIRTQFFCEEISDLTGMFTAARIEAIKGNHKPLTGPEPQRCYVFLIDVAGSDEWTASQRLESGFSDRRDATVVTICDVTLPEGERNDPKCYTWSVVARRFYRNVPAALLETFITQLVDHWDPYHIILDHSGLGCMLSDFLNRKYPYKAKSFNITPANKTKMAWEFLAMVDTGHWREYAVDELTPVIESGFIPGRDAYEVLEDPVLLHHKFIRELQACRMEPTLNSQIVHWGVKDGTRDPHTGRLLHDDLVMSAALAVFEDGSLPIVRHSKEYLDMLREEEEEEERRYQRWKWENF